MPVLDDHSDAKDEDGINSNHAEGSGENNVQVAIRKLGEATNTTVLLCCYELVQANVVLHKTRTGRVEVSAAVELVIVSTPSVYCNGKNPFSQPQKLAMSTSSHAFKTHLLLQQTLDEGRLVPPDHTQISPRLQGAHPHGKTQSESEYGTEDDQPALGTEPASVGREEKRGHGEQKCDEYEYGIDDARCTEISDRLHFEGVGQTPPQ